MKLTLLGTGTPEPSLKRQSSGYIVEIGEDRLILDNGPGAYHRMLEAGYRATDPTHVFFTHFHYDHCIEYPRIVLQHWDQAAGRRPDLQVFGPKPLARLTEQLFGEGGVYEPDLVARTENECSLHVFELRGGTLPRRRPQPSIREVQPGDTIDGGAWTVRVGEGRHFQPQLECYGYRVEADGAVLCYSGDSGAECAGMIDLARDADVLVHMMQFETGTEPAGDFRLCNGTHLDVAKIAKNANVGTLVLTHIGHQIDMPGIRERLISEIASEFSGRVIWGEDLMTLNVGTGR